MVRPTTRPRPASLAPPIIQQLPLRSFLTWSSVLIFQLCHSGYQLVLLWSNRSLTINQRCQILWMILHQHPEFCHRFIDLFDGHFFGAMEWLIFFSRAPSALMVFQWFCQRWTITIKCFLTSRPSTSMVFRWFSDFLGRWLTMVLKFQGYKKCVNSTRDKMCFRNAGERITALNSFRRAESYERGTDRDLIFLEIGTKSNRNPGRPKQGPNNAHLVEYSNMGPRFLQIETHQWAVGNDNQWNLQKQYNT